MFCTTLWRGFFVVKGCRVDGHWTRAVAEIEFGETQRVYKGIEPPVPGHTL